MQDEPAETNRELEISKRLWQFRNETALSRVGFATAAGVDSSTLVRFEHGRARVTYDAVFKIWQRFNLSIKWLVDGKGKMLDTTPIPSPKELDLKPGARVSDVFDYGLSHDPHFFQSLDYDKVQRDKMRYWIWRDLAVNFKECIAMVPEHEIDQFVQSVLAKAHGMINSYGYQDAAVIEQRIHEIESAYGDSSAGDILPTIVLTEGITKDTNAEMLTLQTLLSRLKKATDIRGAKKELAKYIGVPHSSVSRWLAGDKEPGGATTLKLLHWVERQEAKQKSPGSASTPPEPKAQARKSHHENHTQARKKK